MSRKKQDDAEELTPPMGTELPTPAPALAVSCDATKAEKQCTLGAGHAGLHHHVPSADTIDAVVSWA